MFNKFFFHTMIKILIFMLQVDTGALCTKMISEFPGRHWKPSCLRKLVLNIDETGSCGRAKLKLW